MSTAVAACALCGGGVRPSLAAGRWSLLECTSCRHVMAPEALQPAGEAEGLQREHFGDAFVAGQDTWTSRVDRSNARRVCRLLQALVPPGTAVLEVGPGHGALLAALAAAGFRAEGLELSPAVAEAASRRSGVPVRVGTLGRHARGAAGLYGAIVVRHVLEHLSDPPAAAQALHALLAPGGTLYAAVPNFAAPQAALPGWTGYQPYHLHYFTPAHLAGLLERAGFERLAVRTREPFSGWVNAIVNSARGAPRSRPDATRPHAALVTAYHVARLLAGAALTPLRLVQGWSGRGEEIEAVARRGARA